jgi:hypothetical protein
MGYLLHSFPAQPYGDKFKTAQELIRILCKPTTPAVDRRIISGNTKGALGIDHGLNASTAMPLVWHKDVGQSIMNAPTCLATRPPYPQNNHGSYTVNTFSLPARLPITENRPLQHGQDIYSRCLTKNAGFTLFKQLII